MTVFTYIDKTNDGEVFYVGKGTLKRVGCLVRNKKHQRVSSLFGCNREIVLETQCPKEAIAYEIQLIEFFGTFSTDWGMTTLMCNFTLGGEGASFGEANGAKRPETRVKLRKPKTLEMRRKLSASKMGWCPSPESREKCRQAALKQRNARRAKKAST